ncbi:MAG: lysylphosphatidylglycerol synthase transmembrane domain-containing protein [Chloroflexota bacterium]
MPRPRTSIAGILLGLGVSAAALAIAIRWSGWASLLAALEQVDYHLLIPASIVYLVAMGARGLAWQVILGGRAKLWRLLAALNQGYLLNNLLPWRLGEIGRAVLLGRRPQLTPALVLSSIVVERLYDMVLAVGLLLALAPVAFQSPWAPQAALIGGLAVVGAMAFLAVILRSPESSSRLLSRLPGGPARWEGVGRAVQDGLGTLKDVRQLTKGFGWMVVSWALASLEYWLVLRAFIPEAPLAWALLALCVTLLGVAIPSAPGYVGVFEASAVAALAVFGVGGGIALGFALVLHALHFGITTVLGAGALAGEGETLVGAARAARAWLSGSSVEQAG